MDKLELLIADGAEEFSASLAKALSDHFHVHTCRTGIEALAFLKANRPEVMVLDLMVSGLDGISLLHSDTFRECQPMVLATTRLLNDYVIETAVSLNVGYLMVKPCDPAAVAARVMDLSNKIVRRTLPISDPKVYVERLLLELNLRSHLNGSRYLIEAILIMASQPDISLTKELYPMVGSRCGSSHIQVERSIRNAIAQAWEHRNEEQWRKYFLTECSCASRPSNGAFISRLAGEIRNKL